MSEEMDRMEAAQESLVQAVDERERNKNNEYSPEDFSIRVEEATEHYIQTFEKRIWYLADYFPEKEAYLEQEITAFEEGVKAIQEGVESKRHVQKGLIDKIVADIESGFLNDPEFIAQEKAAAFKMIETKSPPGMMTLKEMGLMDKPYALELMEFRHAKLVKAGDFDRLFGFDFTSQLPYYEDQVFNALVTAEARGEEDFFECVATALADGGLPRQITIMPDGSIEVGDWINIKNDHSELVHTYISPEAMASRFRDIAINNPQLYLEYAWVFRDYDFGRDLLNEALESINAPYRLNHLYSIQSVIGEKETTQLVKDTLDEVLLLDPFQIATRFGTCSGYLTESESKDYLLKMAEIDPKAAIGYYHYYGTDDDSRSRKAHPDADEVFQLAAEGLITFDLEYAMDAYSNHLLDEDSEFPFPNGYANSLVEAVWDSNPDLAVENLEFDLIMKAANHFDEIKDTPEWKEGQRRKKRKKTYTRLMLKGLPFGQAKDDLLWGDEALKALPAIDPEWIPIEDETLRNNTAVLLSRNLFFAGEKVNKKNVQTAYKELLKQQEAYGDIPLFEGRHVILTSHNELKPDGGDRFGRKELVADIEAQGAKVTPIESKDSTLKALREAKEQTLNRIAKGPGPLTYLFDGHGAPTKLYLSDGQVDNAISNPRETENTITITYMELAEAFVERAERFGEATHEDIFIIDACNSHIFLRNFSDEVRRAGVQPPIAIAVSEYGQYGYSDYSSDRGNHFYDSIFGKGKDHTIRLGDFWDMEEVPYHNPTVFIPRAKSHPAMQLASLEDNDSGHMSA